MTDAQEFELFMHNYQNMVFSTAMRLLARGPEAEDIAQEVFLKAYERFDDLRCSKTAGGWLKTVTTNLCLNHLSRYRSRWSFFTDLASADEAADRFELDVPATEDTSEAVQLADEHQLLEAAVQQLPDAQRVPLVLHHMEGLSYEEIATKLSCSLGKVKTDIFRARQSLRKALRLTLSECSA